ncbi:NADH-quinone oxidoreductase subunit A [Thermosulfuriphilus ammonigenes]|uniref:NADH-quinone oxidoreductase subunit n=1 Tax=Thermosulfuriphilus ammonigenes TaxID=1936021 RepID=A0A6G7PTM7_9BACT|nr:NADH-quinone oxidoreductase subunit A [Thermosulfuriphilus ammonigenes]MBA2849167.1 NADH-quinone oxidoreductase subunit A [Thermosulfuriphilus ammonigenes]QIJ70783.1 NADH-quinone oxidoreductase subunit A [Thermosulfuriphilus ammonigenes]
MGGFEYIAAYLAIAAVVAAAMIFFSYLLGPKRWDADKLDTYECGVPLLDPSRKRYDVKYYLVAVLFLIFDLETVLIYPLASKFRVYAQYGWAIFIEVFIFVFILLVGLIYALKKGAVEWER